MNVGKLVRMNRLFSHASGRLCSVAVDHFIGYGQGLPAGLRHIERHACGGGGRAARRGDDAQGDRGVGVAAPCGPRSLDHAEHDGPAR